MRYKIIILGTIQDGGYPQIGCELECCKDIKFGEKYIASIAIIDSLTKNWWLIDASPDIRFQIKYIKKYINNIIPNGIFITHAHKGHYTGILEFGKEVINAKNIPLFVMPNMKLFLLNSNPWKQLINDKNLKLIDLNNNYKININNDIIIQPFKVEHRNEISETVGFKIISDKKSIIYLPDIDSWKNINIINLIKENDVLILDGTFYDIKEINNRNITEIPHPFIKDSIKLFNSLSLIHKNKIYFTHLNHSNIMINVESGEYERLVKSGYNILKEDDQFIL